jgi:Ni/Co efflux regulator RcnB
MSPYVRTYVVYDYGRYRLRPPAARVRLGASRS